MYHDTIHIIFTHANTNGVSFEYNFLISKEPWLPNHNSIIYQDLLDKMEDFGFNIKFLDFPDIKDKNINVFCSYNQTPNFLIFFKAYEKVLKPTGFDIAFEYGSMINGKFYMNNMNFHSGVYFTKSYIGDQVNVIIDCKYRKFAEAYQIVDSDGTIIDSMKINSSKLLDVDITNLSNEFFKSRRVTQYLRKYKLRELSNLNFI